MAEIRPVVPPARSRERGLRSVVAAVGALVMLAMIKPWGAGGPAPPPPPSAAPSVTAPDPTATPRGEPDYEPALFGRNQPVPAWELWPAGYVVQFGIAGPVAIANEDEKAAPSLTVGGVPGPGGPADSTAGEPFDLGSADHLLVLGLNTPAGTRLETARLWRFPDTGPAHRQALEELPPPWPVGTFHVLGLRGREGGRTLGAWSPGRYRLDLLTGPGDRVTAIPFLLHGSQPSQPSRFGLPRSIEEIVRGAAPASILFVGADRVTSRLVADASLREDECGLADLWRAEDAGEGARCGQLALTDVRAIVIDPGPAGAVASVTLRRLDPALAAIALQPGPSAVAGRSLFLVPGVRDLEEGTYRLDVRTDRGHEWHWYLRVEAGST